MGYYAKCSRYSKKLVNEHWVEHAAYTKSRYEVCCQNLSKSMNGRKFDALVAHFHIVGQEDREFLDEIFDPGSFKFTILRHPVDQFVSYYKHMMSKGQQPIYSPPLSSAYKDLRIFKIDFVIDIFYNWTMRGQKIPDHLKVYYKVRISSQTGNIFVRLIMRYHFST